MLRQKKRQSSALIKSEKAVSSAKHNRKNRFSCDQVTDLEVLALITLQYVCIRVPRRM